MQRVRHDVDVGVVPLNQVSIHPDIRRRLYRHHASFVSVRADTYGEQFAMRGARLKHPLPGPNCGLCTLS
jgi:hypothetical protein